MVRILLLTSANSSAPLIKILSDYGAEYHIASTPEEALSYMRVNAINGVVINVPSFMRMEGKGKMELSEVLAIFPALRFRVDKQQELTVFDSAREDPHAAISTFFNDVCLKTPQRIIRKNSRILRHFNVLISSEITFPVEQTEQSATMNVSLDGNGCFCFSVRPWETGQDAWLQFLDLETRTPIRAKVMHLSKWGRGGSIPGCGLMFTEIKSEQKEQLIALCKMPLLTSEI